MKQGAAFADNTAAETKRVYYTETSSTIYLGMPVCYEFDATTNVTGYSKSEGGDIGGQSAPNTTDEGYQNEGKFLRVEDPDADNIHAFAGVVCDGSFVGQLGGRWIDIFVPNGSIVPVRCDQNCTVGRTILAVHTGEQFLTAPFESAGRSVAVAWETVDRSTGATTTPGIVLAKLDPSMFLYQKGDALALNVDDQDTGTMMVNQIRATSAQTSGNFTTLGVYGAMTGTGAATGSGIALYVQADVTGVLSGETAGASFWMNLTGGAQTNEIYVVEVGLYEDGADLTSCNRISPLCVRSQLDSTNAPSDGHYMMTFICDGTGDHPDGLFATNEAEDIAMTAETGSMTNAIAFNVGPPGSETTYYLMVSNSVS